MCYLYWLSQMGFLDCHISPFNNFLSAMSWITDFYILNLVEMYSRKDSLWVCLFLLPVFNKILYYVFLSSKIFCLYISGSFCKPFLFFLISSISIVSRFSFLFHFFLYCHLNQRLHLRSYKALSTTWYSFFRSFVCILIISVFYNLFGTTSCSLLIYTLFSFFLEPFFCPKCC